MCVDLFQYFNLPITLLKRTVLEAYRWPIWTLTCYPKWFWTGHGKATCWLVPAQDRRGMDASKVDIYLLCSSDRRMSLHLLKCFCMRFGHILSRGWPDGIRREGKSIHHCGRPMIAFISFSCPLQARYYVWLQGLEHSNRSKKETITYNQRLEAFIRLNP